MGKGDHGGADVHPCQHHRAAHRQAGPLLHPGTLFDDHVGHRRQADILNPF